MTGTAVIVAFGAGFLSFLAPCILPLVPGYLSAVSSVEAEIRADIADMERQQLTPREVGVRVRAHPGRLAIVARNKMGAAKAPVQAAKAAAATNV